MLSTSKQAVVEVEWSNNFHLKKTGTIMDYHGRVCLGFGFGMLYASVVRQGGRVSVVCVVSSVKEGGFCCMMFVLEVLVVY